MMKRNRIFKTIISLILATSLLIPGLKVTVYAENEIFIKSSEDLKKMAKDCRLDTYSLGKVFVLSSDIILDTNSEIQIPVFRGTFNGNGHNISGFIIKENAAPAGLFSIIEADGIVKDLNLSANIIPGGDGQSIGGIAGINNGLIENCSFSGTVSGKEQVGGIAGVNEASGIIKNCSANGKIVGQKMSGGIVGANHGLTDNCTSKCVVNLDYNDPTINIDEIGSDFQASIIDSDKAEKIYSSIEDTGGITGFSDGVITNCINKGDVGYTHIGYNMGGIIGRNQGFVFGCENYGIINGRREVGGIVGQAEPFVSFRPTEDNVSNIKSELYTLNNLVNKATADVDIASGQTSNRLTNITNIISKANDNVKDLSDAMVDFIDENISEVNRGGEVTESVTDRLDSISKKLPGINRKVTKALDSLSKGMDEAKKAGSKASEAMDDFSLAADDLNKAFEILEANTDRINKDAIKEAYSYLTTASNHVNDGITKLKGASDNATVALDYLESASDSINQASREITGVLEEVSSLTDFLSNTPALKFTYIKNKTQSSSNDLHNNMTNLNRELLALNEESKSSSDIFMEDIRAINDQFFVVMSLLIDEINDVKNTSFTNRIEDVSDEDINNSTDGKIQFCTNKGEIFGDINVGGITGSMGIFNTQNPEEGNGSINEVLRARYKLRAILQDCTNYGNITSKKDYVGAVCGISSLGIITDCKGFGSATSKDGDYAGGISGGNSTNIRNSFAKCSISGKKYVGGITGLNSTKDNGVGSIKNCVSAINILSYDQYSGAICGYDEGEIKNNVFFGDYTGINNASYSGKAEPVTFEELIAIEDIPMEFKRFKVSFVAEDKIIKEESLDYLGSLDFENFPEVPAIAGQYGRWDKESIKDIVFDEIITAEYFPYVTAIESKSEYDGPSQFLAIGNFDDVSTIDYKPVFQNEEELNSLKLPGEFFTMTKPKEGWEVTATDLEEKDISLRYYKDDLKADSLAFYVKTNNSWEKLSAKETGTYMEMSVPSGTNTIVVAEKTSYIVFLVLFIIAVILGTILFLITKKLRRRRH